MAIPVAGGAREGWARLPFRGREEDEGEGRDWGGKEGRSVVVVGEYWDAMVLSRSE